MQVLAELGKRFYFRNQPIRRGQFRGDIKLPYREPYLVLNISYAIREICSHNASTFDLYGNPFSLTSQTPTRKRKCSVYLSGVKGETLSSFFLLNLPTERPQFSWKICLVQFTWNRIQLTSGFGRNSVHFTSFSSPRCAEQRPYTKHQSCQVNGFNSSPYVRLALIFAHKSTVYNQTVPSLYTV